MMIIGSPVRMLRHSAFALASLLDAPTLARSDGLQPKCWASTACDRRARVLDLEDLCPPQGFIAQE